MYEKTTSYDKELTMNAECFKQALLNELEGAIHFRKERAELYHDDTRNQDCVDALELLKANVERLPNDDGALVRCFKVYRDKHIAAGHDAHVWKETDSLHSPMLVSDPMYGMRCVTQYGFHVAEDGDAHKFIRELTQVIEGWEPKELVGWD